MSTTSSSSSPNILEIILSTLPLLTDADLERVADALLQEVRRRKHSS